MATPSSLSRVVVGAWHNTKQKGYKHRPPQCKGGAINLTTTFSRHAQPVCASPADGAHAAQDKKEVPGFTFYVGIIFTNINLLDPHALNGFWMKITALYLFISGCLACSALPYRAASLNQKSKLHQKRIKTVILVDQPRTFCKMAMGMAPVLPYSAGRASAHHPGAASTPLFTTHIL